MAVESRITVEEYFLEEIKDVRHDLYYDNKRVISIDFIGSTDGDDDDENFIDEYLVIFDDDSTVTLEDADELHLLMEDTEWDDGEDTISRIITTAVFWIEKGDLEKAKEVLKANHFDPLYEKFLKRIYP